jgi:uroporphyrinogen decarboxylase
MGHKTGTFIAPDHIRRIFIPHHKAIADAAHAAGKMCFIHSCGNVADIMDDLIDTVGVDAHHSTQDVVMPIAEAKRRWGRRLTLLGGIDVDFLTRAPVEQVRPYVRNILEQCAPGGGFALGVGNWVAASMPLKNYLAVLEETRTWQ